MDRRFVASVLYGAAVGVALSAPGGRSDSAAVSLGTNTVITAAKLSFDYKKRVSTFEGDVAVVDPEVRMASDVMSVTFTEKNDVEQVRASGNVKIWQGERVAKCDRAVYDATEGKVVLIGNAELNRGKDVIQGKRITFWVNEERMECEPAMMMIHPTEDGRRDVMGRIGRDASKPKKPGIPEK